jgi:hypothetical protein
VAENFIFESNCKFAVLAIHNVRADVKDNLTLNDSTKVLNTFPFVLDDNWKNWLGTIQFNNLQSGNLFLVCTATEGWPEGHLAISGGAIDEKLQLELGGVFAMLRLLGTTEYENAFMLSGYIESGKPTCRHFATTETFKITGGCLPWVIREQELRTALQLHRSYSALSEKFPERWRFGRGCHALKSALEQDYASYRLHGFIRALEALILPKTGKTEKQFVSRCCLFAGPKAAEVSIRATLQETYRMRCDIEHMHDWDRSLQLYPVAERENIARWRTRQMEELACSVYRKILSDPNLQPHFHSDATIEAFWEKPDDEIRAAFGDACDISRLKIVRKYTSNWRVDPSEWPPEMFENLRSRAKSA